LIALGSARLASAAVESNMLRRLLRDMGAGPPMTERAPSPSPAEIISVRVAPRSPQGISHSTRYARLRWSG
jgi:hypothetical protein